MKLFMNTSASLDFLGNFPYINARTETSTWYCDGVGGNSMSFGSVISKTLGGGVAKFILS